MELCQASQQGRSATGSTSPLVSRTVKDRDMVNSAQLTQCRRSRPIRVLPPLCHLGQSRMIHDLGRDWRRWTKAERAFAPVIAAILLIVIPTIFLTV